MKSPECACADPELLAIPARRHQFYKIEELPNERWFADDDEASGRYEHTAGQAKKEAEEIEIESERKYVTVLFSDISKYNAITERLDPEQIRDMTHRIFSGIVNIVKGYDGHMERIVGDEVLVFFGVPRKHEDDAVRAINAAREIHCFVKEFDCGFVGKIDNPIRMHSAIGSGLVVTGKTDIRSGKEGFAGQPINVAAYLRSIAGPDEILTESATYSQAAGYFNFELLGNRKVKSRSEPVRAYKVLSRKGKPSGIHRLLGFRAELVGRREEMGLLLDAVDNLKSGKGAVISISGEPGVGKSRLVEEFRSRLDPDSIQWLEGSVHQYTQNTPYFPLIDMVNRFAGIEENDTLEILKTKVDSGIRDILDKAGDAVRYVQELYGIVDPQIRTSSPESWKHRLHGAIKTIVTGLSRRAPTVFCFEDLQWSDSHFLELLFHAFVSVEHPLILLCTCRPPFLLFPAGRPTRQAFTYYQMQLKELSLTDVQQMLESLLKSKNIPPVLRDFVQKKTEGNPLLLEELVNALIESE